MFIELARKLAPYQSPRLASIKGGNRPAEQSPTRWSEVVKQFREDAVEADGLILRLPAFRPEQSTDSPTLVRDRRLGVRQPGGSSKATLSFRDSISL
jgi:hypothetical protein